MQDIQTPLTHKGAIQTSTIVTQGLEGGIDGSAHSSPGGNCGSDTSKGDKASTPLSSSDVPYFSVATNHVPKVSDLMEYVEPDEDEYLLVGKGNGEVESMFSSPLNLCTKRGGMMALVMVEVSRFGSRANLSCAKPDFCSSTCTPTSQEVALTFFFSINKREM